MQHRPFIVPGPGGPLIDIAGEHLPARDIVAVRRVEQIEGDDAGTTLGMIAFALLATLVLIGVAEFAWSPRFLVAATGMAALSAMAFSEWHSWRPIRYFRYDIELAAGRVVHFTTADPAAGAALEAVVSGGPCQAVGPG